MNAVSWDIKDMLEADSSLGLVYKTNLFIGKEPAAPKDSVIIFDTAGRSPQMTYNQDEFYEYPSIQIRVTNTSYTTGWNLADSIMKELHNRAQEEWNGSLYTVIQAVHSPALLDWDKNNRVRFVLNFNIQRR